MLKVLCIVQTPVPSTEISIIRPFTYLKKQQQIEWELVREAAFQPELLDQVDLVIFHRNCHPNCQAILQTVINAGIPIIYELDDNYFEIPEEIPIGRYMRNPYVVQTLEKLLESADIVKIGSPELIPHIAKYNQNIIHQPFAVDLGIIADSEPSENADLTIGYAGTINHHLDFEFVIDPIHRIAREFPQVKWDFIGCLPEGAKQLPAHRFTPFIPDYANFLQELHQRKWQIGLCPILDLSHNRCKTDNKFREYGACQIAGIYSNIPPYSKTVLPGETGLLVENSEQAWYEAMKLLINDASLRTKIAVQARKWVEEHRSVPVIAELWIKLFHQTIAKKGAKK